MTDTCLSEKRPYIAVEGLKVTKQCLKRTELLSLKNDAILLGNVSLKMGFPSRGNQ